MKRTNIYLREDQTKKLGAITAKTGAPMAVLVRRAIDRFLKIEQK